MAKSTNAVDAFINLFTPKGKSSGALPSTRTTRMGDVGFDPRYDERIKEQNKLNNLTTKVEERPLQYMDELYLPDYEGEGFVSSMSDRTAAGGMLVDINGVPLKRPINLRGGQDYMFDNEGQVWASAEEPVRAIMMQAAAAKALTGKDPLFLPWRMAPTGGDFAHMTGETMLSFAESSMGKADKQLLNAEIKKFIPNWKGIDSSKSIDQYRALPDAQRKALKTALDKNFRESGGLGIGEARLAVSDPSQLISPEGYLMNVGRIFADKKMIEASGHPSYPKGVPGEGIGRIADERSLFEFNPKVFPPEKDIRSLLLDPSTARSAYENLPDVNTARNIADPRNPSFNDTRALQMKPYYGILTDKLLRQMGYAEGGMVETPAQEAIADTVRNPNAARMLEMDLANLSLLNQPKQQPQRMKDGGSFNPQGSDYDYQTAKAYGMNGKKGNFGSVAPTSDDERALHGLPEDSYVMLKGANHPTWGKAVEAEQDRGSKIVKYGDRYYSIPNMAEGGEVSPRLFYEKRQRLPSGVVADTGQADGVYQEPSVASETSRVFGMDPKADRLSILPRYSREEGLVAPQILYDAAKAITAPSVALRGYEVAPDEALNLAMNVAGGGFGASSAMRNPTGKGGKDLGMFMGEKSLGADLGARDIAKARLAAGEDPALVFKETGWLAPPWAPDQLRYEISDMNLTSSAPAKVTAKSDAQEQKVADLYYAKRIQRRMNAGETLEDALAAERSEMRLRTPPSANAEKLVIKGGDIGAKLEREMNKSISTFGKLSGTVGDFVNHPEFFAGYPDFAKDIKFNTLGARDAKKLYGSFSAKDKELSANAEVLRDTPEKSIETIIHELQHAVQSREAFNPGGSSKGITTSPHLFDPKMFKAREDLMSAAAADTGRLGDLYRKKQTTPLTFYEAQELNHRISNMPEYTKFQQAGRDFKSLGSADERYLRLAGEAEARLTQNRKNLTQQERLDRYPYDPARFNNATGYDLDEIIANPVRKGNLFRDGGQVPSPEEMRIEMMERGYGKR